MERLVRVATRVVVCQKAAKLVFNTDTPLLRLCLVVCVTARDIDAGNDSSILGLHTIISMGETR